jgi:hypothetical protein
VNNIFRFKLTGFYRQHREIYGTMPGNYLVMATELFHQQLFPAVMVGLHSKLFYQRMLLIKKIKRMIMKFKLSNMGKPHLFLLRHEVPLEANGTF